MRPKIKRNDRIKKNYLIFYFSGLLLIPTVLLILPANYIDSGQSICLSVLLFNEKCYSCGMTRAIQHLIHFDFSVAYSYNKASFILFLILTFSWFTEIIHTYKNIKKTEYEQYVGPLSGLAAIILIATSKITGDNKKQMSKTLVKTSVILGIVTSVFLILISIVFLVMIITKH